MSASDGAVASWLGNHRMTAYPLAFSQISHAAGHALFWSVRACTPSSQGSVEANGARYACTDWAVPRRLNVRDVAAVAGRKNTNDRDALHAVVQTRFRQHVCRTC